MKNPLADIIRQSSGSEHALSDSGSFDTAEGVLGPTANDEQVVSDDAIDLKLLEATGALVLDNGTVRFEVTEAPVLEEPPVFVAARPQRDAVERAPLLSRFAPAICVAVVLVTAAGWTTYRYLQTTYADDALGMTGAADTHDSDAVAGTVHVAGAERFPFIDPEAVSGETQ